MVANILGQGIDIHLLGLREQGKEMGLQLELFSDEAYKIANHFALSTSQVQSITKSTLFLLRWRLYDKKNITNVSDTNHVRRLDYMVNGDYFT